MAKMKTFPKLLLIMLIAGGIMGGLFYFRSTDTFNDASSKMASSKEAKAMSGVETVTVGVVTWGGYAGGQYFNNGFKASKDSRFFKDYGFLVEFKVIDDFLASREAWKAGEVDLMWITADSFPTEAGALASYSPKVIFQSDWSRGGDVAVVDRSIKTANDLKGKKVAVAFGTPSHTFLINMLKASGMSLNDIQVVEAPSAIDAASYFKARQVEAAIVWSPDDADCLANVPGAHVLQSTKDATHIIADVFYAKEDYIDSHREILANLIEGWMIGASEINTSNSAKQDAAKILSAGLNMPYDFCLGAIDNVRLATYGDNTNFFNLNGTSRGVTGEKLYNTMKAEYAKIGLSQGAPSWRTVVDSSLIRDIQLAGVQHTAEKSKSFAVATVHEERAQAISSKPVNIYFPSGVSNLDPNMERMIDMEFVEIAKSYPSSRIRIEGNTDATGGLHANIDLSKKRANAVKQYLVEVHGFDSNRIIAVGNGPSKPIADNNSENGRSKNRRTEFQLLAS